MRYVRIISVTLQKDRCLSFHSSMAKETVYSGRGGIFLSDSRRYTPRVLVSRQSSYFLRKYRMKRSVPLKTLFLRSKYHERSVRSAYLALTSICPRHFISRNKLDGYSFGWTPTRLKRHQRCNRGIAICSKKVSMLLGQSMIRRYTQLNR